METYEEVRRLNYRTIRKSWLPLLYMMFAMAAFTWPHRRLSIAHPNEDSEAWFKMACELTLPQVFSDNGANLEVGMIPFVPRYASKVANLLSSMLDVHGDLSSKHTKLDEDVDRSRFSRQNRVPAWTPLQRNDKDRGRGRKRNQKKNMVRTSSSRPVRTHIETF